MNPLTRRDVIAHQASVPWPLQRQVEQDLLLCLAMAALFNDGFLQSQIAMRGGTLLHKVHLAPAARYSEDIDLVVYGDRPKTHIAKAIKRVLKDVFGKPTDSIWDTIQLAVRNAVKPSEVLRLTYSVPAVSEPGATLDIVVEANVTERKPHRDIAQIPFEFTYRGATIKSALKGYDLHEMLGTKMRALFQRKRGRDLFDLYWALTLATPAVDPAIVIDSFRHYLKQEGHSAARSEFTRILDSHLADRGFCNDMVPLLRVGLDYDPKKAGVLVKTRLLGLLPDK
jgi:predicted nucleotidyltransferase component of viral defense system